MPVVDAVASPNTTTQCNHHKAHSGANSFSVTATLEAVVDRLEHGGWAGRIASLKKQTKQLRDKRQRVAKHLKAAQRKNRRLKERALCLSENGIMSIVMMKRSKSGAEQIGTTGGSSSSNGNISTTSTPNSCSPDAGLQGATPVEPSVHAEDDMRDVRMDA